MRTHGLHGSRTIAILELKELPDVVYIEEEAMIDE